MPLMSQTTSAPAPQPSARPTALTHLEMATPPPPQPGAVPTAPAAQAQPTPTQLPSAISQEQGPELTAAPTAVPVATNTGGSAPNATHPASPPFPEPTGTQALQPTPTQAPVQEPASTAPVPQSSMSEVDIKEPQSSLTKKFTEAEWTALKELRSKLPDIFADAFPDNENARTTPVTIWGVDIDPSNPLADARVSVVLMKFLRARNLNVNDASEKFIGTLQWRKTFDVEGALKEEFPQDVFGNLAHISGTDKDGRLVVYNIYGGNQDLKAVFGDVQRFIRWRVAFMERCVKQLDFTEFDQMIQVHDYEGVGLTSRDANSKAAASEATSIFQNHYPEMLYKKFFINVPTIMNWIFWLFKPVISANTLAKMSVVGTGKDAIRSALSDHILPKAIPQRYGGEGEEF